MLLISFYWTNEYCKELKHAYNIRLVPINISLKGCRKNTFSRLLFCLSVFCIIIPQVFFGLLYEKKVNTYSWGQLIRSKSFLNSQAGCFGFFSASVTLRIFLESCTFALSWRWWKFAKSEKLRQKRIFQILESRNKLGRVISGWTFHNWTVLRKLKSDFKEACDGLPGGFSFWCSSLQPFSHRFTTTMQDSGKATRKWNTPKIDV